MRLDFGKVWVIAKREYMTRIKSKGFWIATVAIPLFMSAMMVGPSLLLDRLGTQQRISLVDATGGTLGSNLAARISETLSKAPAEGARGNNVVFRMKQVPLGQEPQKQRAELDRQVLGGDIDAWIWLSPEGLAKDRFEYHAKSVSNFMTQSTLERRVSEVVREERFRSAGFDVEQVGRLSRSLDVEALKVGEGGAGKGGFVLALGLFFMLYTTLLVYGSQVMQGVLEEKSSRVIEVLAAAVPASALMFGKLLGICALALTQLAIWLATGAVLTAPSLLAAVLSLPADSSVPTLTAPLILHCLLLFLLGFLLFASFYAMIGAAFNSLQEAQQFASIAMIFIIGPVLFMMPVINDPNSTLAVVTSLFPFFTPLVMMLRIAVETPPMWQILLGYALLVVAIFGMTWFASRVYRVGILMYGKKPTLPELWKWARYS
jgi:ABC-2 type transport system permease protein